MEDLIKKEILEIEKKYNISLEESLVVFCSILAELYFINKIGVRYEKQIKRLIYSQTSVDTNKFDLKDLLLQKEMREIFDREDVDIIGNVYNKFINGEVKKIFGKFYTPAPLVQHLLDSIKLHENKNGQIIDIACGAGIFLAASIRSLIRLNNKEDRPHLLNKLIEQINGIDIDEFACRLTRLNLLIGTFSIWKELLSAGGKLNINFNIKHANSLELFANEILDKKFDFVIGNPPYVESKKLPLKIKQICRKLYPEASRGCL